MSDAGHDEASLDPPASPPAGGPLPSTSRGARTTLSRIDVVRAPRFPRRFRTRLFTYVTILTLATAVASAAVYYWRQLGFIEKDRTRRARTLLTSLATQSELGAYAGDAALCERAARRTFSEEDVVLVAIYDRHGREILHFASPTIDDRGGAGAMSPSLSALRHMLASPDAPPERHAMASGPSGGWEDLYAPIVTATRDPADAFSIGPGGAGLRHEVVGIARVGLSLTPVRDQLGEMLRAGVYLSLLQLALGLVAALLISRNVSRPIGALTVGADRIRAGDLDTRVTISSQDELGQLGYSFNRMAARLAETMTALETLNRDLEAEVARRTLAIQRAAEFSALLNAPVGQDLGATVDEGAPDAPIDDSNLTGGTARGALARILDAALEALAQATGARAAAILLTDEEAVDFELSYAWRRGATEAAFGPPPTESEIASGQLLRDRKAPSLPSASAGSLGGARLVVPLVIGREPEGCVILLGDVPTSDDVTHFATHAAAQLAIAVSNVRAYATLGHLAHELTFRNAALAKQRDQLQEMNRLKSEFLANTSHELRTPLNAIIGYSELVADGIYGPVTDEQRTALAGIDESSKNLVGLINQILDLAKVEAGKMTLHVEEVDVGALARQLLAEATGLTKDRPYEVQLVVEGTPKVRTDEPKVKQILSNLVANAIKFTPAGEVVVTVLEGAGGGCTIAVRDTGIGIRMEDQKLIFEEFRQVDGSYTRQYGGTGLGLAIARRLAELLGATISVESALGKGSTFTVTLPKEPPAPVAARPDTPSRRAASVPPPLPREALKG